MINVVVKKSRKKGELGIGALLNRVAWAGHLTDKVTHRQTSEGVRVFPVAWLETFVYTRPRALAGLQGLGEVDVLFLIVRVLSS